MADTKLSALTELAATPADADEVYIRDVSEVASAESKRITIANLKAAMPHDCVFTKQVTSAANAGDVLVATVTTQPCLIKRLIVRSNGATTADLTNIGVYGGAGKVVTFIDNVTGVRANIAAADQQVYTSDPVSLPATKTIVITLTGGGATAVDFQIDIEYEAVVAGGYLL
uniref:Uncharacterized protein n=1 Tax=viral metagenome TaxID=1070528 RepID=A0A6M3J2I9_9ZZZZ